jgi:hypothetical protein
MNIQHTNTAEKIRSLASKHGVAYTATRADEWSSHVTRLAGDNVVLDPVELLLIELQRTGNLTRPEALALQVSYLREARL